MVLYELSFPMYIFIFPIVLLLISMVLPITLSKLLTNETNKANIKKIQYSGGILIVVMILLLCIPTVKDYCYIAEKYFQGDYLEVTGYVDKFSLLNSAKNQQEQFSIGDVSFSYGFAGKMNFVGYQKTKNNGGIIKGNGQYLKIRYVSYNDANIIVYVEQK